MNPISFLGLSLRIFFMSAGSGAHVGRRLSKIPVSSSPQGIWGQSEPQMARSGAAATIAFAISFTGSIPRFLARRYGRSEEHTSELQSLMRISYAVFCLKKKKIG